MEGKRRKSVPSTISVPSLLSILIALVAYVWPQPFQGLDAKIYDMKLRLWGSTRVAKEIVHLDVDDKAVKAFGSWPWDREISARIVNRLSEFEAGIVVFDILFASQGRSPDGNMAFFKALSSSGREISATGLGVTDSDEGKIVVPEESSRADALYRRTWPVEVPQTFKLLRVRRLSDSFVPLTAIIENSRALGHIKSTPDSDGVHRRVPLLVRFEDRCLPSLSLAAVAAYLNADSSRIILADSGQLEIQHDRGVLKIPIDSSGGMLITWQKPWKSFAHYSVVDLLSSDPDPQRPHRYKDKIVVIGVTSTGATDIGMSPLSKECPLSRIHSNAINTMLTGRFIRTVPTFPYVVLFAVALAVLFSFVAPKLRLQSGTIIACTAVVVYVFVSALGFIYLSLEIPMTAPVVVFAVPAAIALSVRGILAESEAVRISKVMQRYLSPEMLDSIINGREEIDLSTRRKELTILFADIQGFSRISEAVDIEYLEKFLDEFFEAMTLAVFDNRGTVDKFLGDGLLAFFGWPVELENHALAAIRAGDQMSREMARLNGKWSGSGISEFERGIHVRIGISTGLVVVGNVGSRRRMEYTVLGSAVNLASRLQAMARPNGVLMSGRTYALCKHEVRCKEPKTVRVKGIDKDIVVYELETVV
jgi:adenylate cyclase